MSALARSRSDDDLIRNPPVLGYPWTPINLRDDPETVSKQLDCGCIMRTDGEAVLCPEHLAEINEHPPPFSKIELSKCDCGYWRWCVVWSDGQTDQFHHGRLGSLNIRQKDALLAAVRTMPINLDSTKKHP